MSYSFLGVVLGMSIRKNGEKMSYLKKKCSDIEHELDQQLPSLDCLHFIPPS